MPTPKMPLMTALGADWWNDSCAPEEIAEAVSFGAVGGTSNPVIVFQAVKGRPERWLPVLDRLIVDHPTATEDDIAWMLIAELARAAAAQFLPVFERSRGAKGYLSIQVSPKFYPDPERMVSHAVQLAALAPNIAIKAPATAAGIAAMEEMTARGIRINATVSFSVAQAVAVAQMLERGLRRARAAGHDADAIRPYITLMIGRVDDQLKRVAEKEAIAATPGVIEQSGIAVFKAAHRLFRAKGYPGTLLAAAYRHQGHWSEIIGRDVLQTIPYSWWTKFNTCDHTPTLSLDHPVDEAVVAELRAKFPDFVRAYDSDGMTPAQFATYGATRHTLNQFLGGYADLIALVRTRMLA